MMPSACNTWVVHKSGQKEICSTLPYHCGYLNLVPLHTLSTKAGTTLCLPLSYSPRPYYGEEMAMSAMHTKGPRLLMSSLQNWRRSAGQNRLVSSKTDQQSSKLDSHRLTDYDPHHFYRNGRPLFGKCVSQEMRIYRFFYFWDF